MIEMPLVSAGAVVTIATSNDEDHPASNIIDGNENTFWMTTGLYPQSVTITFPQTIEARQLRLSSFGIRNLVVEKSLKSHPVEFEPIAEKTLKYEDRKMQNSEIMFSRTVELRHLKLIILDGHDSFACIQHVRIESAKR